jgi:Activator of Hsp90 ATPase homolog 1-like protein
MENLSLTHPPITRKGILVSKPAVGVFESFADPAIPSHFWFAKSSSELEAVRRVGSEWEMHGVSTLGEVKKRQLARPIRHDWDPEREPTQAEWTFTAFSANLTLIEITNSGLSRNGDKIGEQVMGSEAGYALMQAGLKACLEHAIELHLVADRFPNLSSGF